MFSQRELATVLAALRSWQRQTADDRPMESSFTAHFDEASPLTASEIDALCERLNIAPLEGDFADL